MLTQVSLSEMETMLAKERYYQCREDRIKDAQHLLETLDSRFDNILSVYAKEGRYTDYDENGMSVITISSLRNCGFLEAVILMNAYLKNPADGLDQIVRR